MSKSCTVHGDVAHGGEAEELRKGIESIIDRAARCARWEMDDVLAALRKLLDETDARDSLAFVERRIGQLREYKAAAYRRQLREDGNHG